MLYERLVATLGGGRDSEGGLDEILMGGHVRTG